jgi:putative pyruvate formate lyase activating enzyme
MATPSYVKAYQNGKLDMIIKKAFALLEACTICPRRCGVNRLNDEEGFCKIGKQPKVYSFMPHQGEEPPLSGQKGSGTIFFSACNMRCVYCQNYEFSQLLEGKFVSTEELANIMLQLQLIGCHNINLVTPTHIMPYILKALSHATSKGLSLPLVYNTSGYESPEIIALLDGIIDIYLADMRYADEEAASRYSSAPDYPHYNQKSIQEMHRQVGTVKTDSDGIILKGLIIRHLVLPNAISGTEKIMRFIRDSISEETYISLMSQYMPYFQAPGFKELSRRLTHEEYKEAKNIMRSLGLSNGWTQEGRGLKRLAGTQIKRSL